MTDSTVRLTDVIVDYGRHRALDGVSLAFGTGVTGLLGPNGAGKTTLLRVVATALEPSAGAVDVLGLDPRAPAGRLSVRRRLGYVPQEPGFHPGFTAFQFLDYVAILKELTDRRRRHQEVRRVLDAVDLMDVRGKRIKSLSGGMRRRVAVGAALLGDPDLLVMDEPTAGLDPEQRLRFREFLGELGERHTVLLSTHQTEDVMSLCRRVVVLHGGRVRFEGDPAGLAAVAAGNVWSSPEKPPAALVSWRTGSGGFRNVGRPPDGAAVLEPSLEDGYMLLLGGPDADGRSR